MPKTPKVDTDAVDGSPEPVTVIQSPAGNLYAAGDWSEANQLLGMPGYVVAEGWPTGPTIEVPDAGAGARGAGRRGGSGKTDGGPVESAGGAA